eukprot:g1563.t1
MWQTKWLDSLTMKAAAPRIFRFVKEPPSSKTVARWASELQAHKLDFEVGALQMIRNLPTALPHAQAWVMTSDDIKTDEGVGLTAITLDHGQSLEIGAVIVSPVVYPKRTGLGSAFVKEMIKRSGDKPVIALAKEHSRGFWERLLPYNENVDVRNYNWYCSKPQAFIPKRGDFLEYMLRMRLGVFNDIPNVAEAMREQLAAHSQDLTKTDKQ